MSDIRAEAVRARNKTGPCWELPRAWAPGLAALQGDIPHVPKILPTRNTTNSVKAETFPRALQAWYLLREMKDRKELLKNPRVKFVNFL